MWGGRRIGRRLEQGRCVCTLPRGAHVEVPEPGCEAWGGGRDLGGAGAGAGLSCQSGAVGMKWEWAGWVYSGAGVGVEADGRRLEGV